MLFWVITYSWQGTESDSVFYKPLTHNDKTWNVGKKDVSVCVEGTCKTAMLLNLLHCRDIFCTGDEIRNRDSQSGIRGHAFLNQLRRSNTKLRDVLAGRAATIYNISWFCCKRSTYWYIMWPSHSRVCTWGQDCERDPQRWQMCTKKSKMWSLALLWLFWGSRCRSPVHRQ